MTVQPFIRMMCLARRLSTVSVCPALPQSQSSTHPWRVDPVRSFSATSPSSCTRGTTVKAPRTFMGNRIARFGLGGSMVPAGTATLYWNKHPSIGHAIINVPSSHLFSQTIVNRCSCTTSINIGTDMPGWTDESKKVYQQYSAELLSQGWTQILISVGKERNMRLFSFNHPDIGSTFEYAMFCNEDEERSIAIMQFGEKVEGPEGYVHGGAIATAADLCSGRMMNTGLQITSVTASLTVNYKRPIPLCSTIIIETRLDRVERKKYYVTITMKSVDGSILYNEVTILFINAVAFRIPVVV